MSGQPDPKPPRRPRPSERRREPIARVAPCWGCGTVSTIPRHHLIPKDFTKPGPDDGWNIIPLCGTGTSGCHGAFHGSPWVDESGRRHDADSVSREIAGHLTSYAEAERVDLLLQFLDDDETLLRFLDRVLRVRVDTIERFVHEHNGVQYMGVRADWAAAS